MIDNKDVLCVSKLLVKTHGVNAEAIAAQHIDQNAKAGIYSGYDQGGGLFAFRCGSDCISKGFRWRSSSASSAWSPTVMAVF
jgi:hypothetical protein